MADLDVKPGPNGYGVKFPDGKSMTVAITVNDFERIERMAIRYPNGTSVTVGRNQDGAGQPDPTRSTLRIEGPGVTGERAAADVQAVLRSNTFMQTLIDQGRIDNSGAVTPVGGARKHADAFAAQITPEDSIVKPARAPAPVAPK